MNDAFILFSTLGITIIIGIIIQYFLWQQRIKERNSIDKDWEDFLKASSNENIELIKLYVDKLLWNQYLKKEQLDKISTVVDSNLEQDSELEKIRLEIYNKRIS